MARLLLLLLLAGCSKPPALVPYDSTSSLHGGPDIGGMNHSAVERYNAGQFEDASRAFLNVVAHLPEPQYFFNLCLARTQTGDLDGACLACIEVFRYATVRGLDDEQREDLTDRARRQLARIAVTAKQRNASLDCVMK